MRKLADRQIRRNIQYPRWKLRGANSQVMETLLTSYARSLLIYIGTPMVAANLWQTQNIEDKEKSYIKDSMMLPRSANPDIIANTIRNT